ncbi:glycosyltransferase family 9 protein [Pseudocolwellia agarivorans]|uniref:glycosyltransferase family 9 protein n=1 Tax=Pseudocolwellia agarivorans TaxID=1911682 RepID=UPI000986B08A|nr:hypothetical protein [Pseudocolwellia agarivorans]
MTPKNVLFIPVSSPSGIGEYMRSLVIAKALLLQWPKINIHFILNNQVDYIKDCPYTVHTCQNSPTKDIKGVNNIIKTVQPDLVIFDASGRAAHFKQAKAVGAKVAFISQHNKKRNRGLKINRLLFTDIHWVVQPNYCMKPLNALQKAKLRLFNKKEPKNIGPVFDPNNKKNQQAVLKQFSLIEENYFVFNAGSGGHLIEGKLAADIYYQAAQAFNLKTQIKCVVIFGSNYPKNIPEALLDYSSTLDPTENKDANNTSNIIGIKNIDNAAFIALISAAQGCVISAGDTILQCIALHKPCTAAPVSSDQPVRLTHCQNKKLVLPAKPTPEDLTKQALRLIDKKDELSQTLVKNMAQQAPIDGLAIIIEDIISLFTKAPDKANDKTLNKRNNTK